MNAIYVFHLLAAKRCPVASAEFALAAEFACTYVNSASIGAVAVATARAKMVWIITWT